MPLPRLNEAQKAKAARLLNPTPTADPYDLKYQHFSLAVNSERRMTFYTAPVDITSNSTGEPSPTGHVSASAAPPREEGHVLTPPPYPATLAAEFPSRPLRPGEAHAGWYAPQPKRQGSMFKFLHAADIHLDSPLVGLDQYESAPVDAIRGATRRAFENLVQLAIEEGVAFVLLAGDLYDGDWKDYRTGLFFVEQMAKLREAAIPVFVVAGNHDAASQLTKNLQYPANVHIFSTKKPETHRLDALDVAIHGQGFPSRAVTEDLAATYPLADPGLFAVGLLHTSLDGREGHATYAPTSVQVLAQKGYQYWALGHVHKREIISNNPWIVFPGNTQGRHARETGPKGCTLVTVEGGAVSRVDERPIDVLRWAVCRIDPEGTATTAEMLDRVLRTLESEADRSDGRALAVRVEVDGPAAFHDEIAADPDRWMQEVRAVATGFGSADVWVEKVRFATKRPGDLAQLAMRDDAIGSLIRDIGSAAGDPAEMEALRASLSEIHGILPRELLDGVDAADPQAPATLARLIAEARELLLARIARQGTAT